MTNHIRRSYNERPINYWVISLCYAHERPRMFRSLIIRTGTKERNIRARNLT